MESLIQAGLPWNFTPETWFLEMWDKKLNLKHFLLQHEHINFCQQLGTKSKTVLHPSSEGSWIFSTVSPHYNTWEESWRKLTVSWSFLGNIVLQIGHRGICMLCSALNDCPSFINCCSKNERGINLPLGTYNKVWITSKWYRSGIRRSFDPSIWRLSGLLSNHTSGICKVHLWWTVLNVSGLYTYCLYSLTNSLKTCL